MGYAVGSAGDLNGDGHGDVAVGAPKDRLALDKEGVVSVFYGRSQGLPGTPDWQIGSGQSGSGFGAAVAGAGDVNGDGYDDLLIGAPEFKYDGNTKGAVYLFLGSSTGLEAEPNWFTIGDQKDGRYGAAVAGAGDVNGDGYDDWLVGAPQQSCADLGENHGVVYLFLGGVEPIDPAPYWEYRGDCPVALAGTSVAGAGDVNGDGYDDIAAGAPGYTGDLLREGAVLLFLGSDTGPGPTPDWHAVGGQEDARMGTSVTGAGDVDGDALDDLLAGAPHYDTAHDDTGAAFLFYGRDPVPVGSPALLSPPLSSGSLFGCAVAGGGDLDGDGYDDVIVGACYATMDQRQEGAVFAFYGSREGVSSSSGWHAEGDKADTEFGYASALVTGIRGEGVGSVIVGAPGYRLHTDPEGCAVGFYGPLAPAYPYYQICLPVVVRAQP
ncbi:MAG: FG-GAP repeat protein [Anaerolineae bacterium]|nr:FG-GAP repeat protein [Anaerolineae bacterium]